MFGVRGKETSNLVSGHIRDSCNKYRNIGSQKCLFSQNRVVGKRDGAWRSRERMSVTGQGTGDVASLLINMLTPGV